ncbi:deoxyribonuclease IV [Beduinella massiliensis]|uniref:deoxyribonuclease IV n=1 Tax=Beduinella massiliensis TaxID=1852363 RepID=UPI000C845CCE
MLHIGCHLSAAKGFEAMGRQAVAIDADTFQFFTRNPRGGNAKAIDLDDVQNLRQILRTHEFPVILAHAPYTLNGCSADESIRAFATRTMREDLDRLEYLPGNLYNFHPGSHVGQGVERGIELICQMLDEVPLEDLHTTVLLETMAGKGSEVGRTFEEIRAIIDGARHGELLGVCLDTCHVYDAGYDIVGDLDGVLRRFDEVIGLDRLRAVHLNDSKNPFESHKDRHEKIGQGSIGLDAFVRIVNHPRLCHLPFYLETPNELDGYAAEIALLRAHYAP